MTNDMRQKMTDYFINSKVHVNLNATKVTIL